MQYFYKELPLYTMPLLGAVKNERKYVSKQNMCVYKTNTYKSNLTSNITSHPMQVGGNRRLQSTPPPPVSIAATVQGCVGNLH